MFVERYRGWKISTSPRRPEDGYIADAYGRKSLKSLEIGNLRKMIDERLDGPKSPLLPVVETANYRTFKQPMPEMNVGKYLNRVHGEE